MASYFLPNLSTEQIFRLQVNQILMTEYWIGNESGVIVGETNLAQCLNVLGLYNGGTSPTEIDGIVRINLVTEPRHGNNQRVKLVQWRSSGSDLFRDITAEVLLPEVGNRTINLIDRRGTATEARTRPDTFEVSFFGYRRDYSDYSTPARIYGVELGRRSSFVFSPDVSRNAIQINDDQGTPVAELYNGSILYILFHLNRDGSRIEGDVYRRILQAAVSQLRQIRTLNGSVEQDTFRNANIGHEDNRARYIRVCGRRMGNELEQLRSRIASYDSTIADLSNRLAETIRAREDSQVDLSRMESSNNLDVERFGPEYDALAAQEKVLRVDLDNDWIYVYTDTLYCVDPRDNVIHEIGKFKIKMSLRGDQIFWQNLTRRVDGRHAPHIYADGHACLGNIQNTLPGLVGTYQYSVAASIAIQFVESVNTSDSFGRQIVEWPVVREIPQPQPQAAAEPPTATQETPTPPDNQAATDEDAFDRVRRVIRDMQATLPPDPTPEERPRWLPETEHYEIEDTDGDHEQGPDLDADLDLLGGYNEGEDIPNYRPGLNW